MGKMGEVLSFMRELGQRVPWDQIDVATLMGEIDRVGSEFVRFLQNGGRLVAMQFPTGAVTLGRHQTPEAYVESITARGRRLDASARFIASKVPCSGQRRELRVVELLDKQLGLMESYTISELYSRARLFGYYPCPAEAGLALADQYGGQPSGEYRRMAMEAIANSLGFLRVFCVFHAEGGLGLGTCSGDPQDRLTSGHSWVFTTCEP